jgi:hypothetical protein
MLTAASLAIIQLYKLMNSSLLLNISKGQELALTKRLGKCLFIPNSRTWRKRYKLQLILEGAYIMAPHAKPGIEHLDLFRKRQLLAIFQRGQGLFGGPVV